MVKKMKDAGVPIHGIGMQGHYNIYGPKEEDIDKALSLYTGHEFLTWRRILKELAPLLFK